MEILDCQYIESQRQVIFRNSYEKRRALERKGFKVGHENYGDNTVIMVKPVQVLAEVADYTGNVYNLDLRGPICKYYNYQRLTKKRYTNFINDYKNNLVRIEENDYGEIIILSWFEEA